MKGETEYYQELTILQKNVVDALSNMGFKYLYFTIYESPEFGHVDVCKFDRMSDVMRKFHELGRENKRCEIINVLGIY